MVNRFLELKQDEVLLMYMSEGYCNNSGQGDRGVIGNLYSLEDVNKKINEWNDKVLSEIKGTNVSLDKAYSDDGIYLTKLVYEENGEVKDIIDDTEDNKKLLGEIREKCERYIDGFEIDDIIYYYAKVYIKDNELELRISYDACYQSVSEYITIKKVKKEDVRYCVIIERPVNSRECGQYVLAGPYKDYNEANELLCEFSSERDLYGTIRNPYIIATYTSDPWLKNHYKKNGIYNKN